MNNSTLDATNTLPQVTYTMTTRAWCGAIALFLVGLALTSGHARLLPDGAFYVFKQIARAQYQLYQAGQNINADGHAEYAVLLKGAGADQALEHFLSSKNGWAARASSLPGWAIVTTPAEAAKVVPILREQSFAKAVLRNRGVWICH